MSDDQKPADPTEEDGVDYIDYVEEILSERDVFRLSVRGVTLMEVELEGAIGEAFPEGMPPVLERLQWPSLVALAKALELITEDLRKALLVLGKIRNAFAHEMADEMSHEHVNLLSGVIPALWPKFDRNEYSPDDLFRMSMQVTFDALVDTIEHAEDQREQAAAELERFRSARLALSVRPPRGQVH